MAHLKLGEILIQHGLITEDQMREAIKFKKEQEAVSARSDQAGP